MIETARLLLRRWRRADAAPFHAMGQDLEVMRHLGPPVPLADCTAAVARLQKEAETAADDADTAREMLAQLVTLAENDIAASLLDSDRNPPVFDPDEHTVTIPESFKKSYNALVEGGWDKLSVSEELGGTPMPSASSWCIALHVLAMSSSASTTGWEAKLSRGRTSSPV